MGALHQKQEYARRLEIIHRKITSVEQEIALIEGGGKPKPNLFEQEHSGLRSLRERLARLRELAAGIEKELGTRR